MPVWARWVFGVLIAAMIVGVPTAHHRATYVHAKRLRIVTDDKFYRCGQLPADGFRDAVRQYHIGTIINLQQEAKDPLLPQTWLESWRGRGSVRESDLCEKLGVAYVSLDGGVLDHPDQLPGGRPVIVDDFIAVIENPAKYPPPYLMHCHAGRDRTGLMVAIYRMEFEHRTKAEVVREMRANGFATFAATEGNVYLDRLILQYEPGIRRGPTK